MKDLLSLSITFFFMSLFLTDYGHAQNAVNPANLKINATFQHIAIHYNISGDDNNNSTLDIKYRKLGSTSNFDDAAQTMQATPNLIVDGNPLNRHYHAGSIFFLDVDTDYEIIVDLDDPDGGGILDTIITRTQGLPIPDPNGTERYVIPGNGGGTGTLANPFKGLQAAADNVQAGDIVYVQAGNYSSFNLNTNGLASEPIVFRSQDLHKAVIDGQGINTGVVTLGVYNDSLKHVIIDGFTIKNGRWGIDAQNTQYLTIQNNILEDVDYGIVNRRANGWEHDQYIVNNSLVGKTTWPQTNGNIPGERGIDIRGNRNVVSFNYISNFGDGISTDGPPYGASFCLDIHNNDIINIVDDAIEVDGCVSNTAVYSNRCFNARMGVSLAPVLGGPCYIFRNVLYNLETSAYKMNREPSGLIICHNTSLKCGNGMSSNANWQNTFLRNNIVMGDRYCFEEFGLANGSIDDWDYNGYFSTRMGSGSEPWFKWNNTRYDNVNDLQNSTSIESNGITSNHNHFVDADVPTDYAIQYDPMNIDVNLLSNVNAIDAGDVLNNINDPFVFDGSPDIGALEFGQPNPIYGPDFDLVSSGDFMLAADDITVYPNPATHFIIISGMLQDYHIRILNSQGQLFENVDNSGQYHALDIGHLGQGLYFIEFENISNQTISVCKVIKF